jgi:polysaccharide chain length determinant protein (PEP-CTERM system associated)
MDDFEALKQQLLFYIRCIWKHRWLAIIIAWPLMIGGMMYVDSIKDRYTAETKVFIDTTSLLKPLLKGLAIETDLDSSIKLMEAKLLSRPNLERAIRQLDMDLGIHTPLEMEYLIEAVKNRVNIIKPQKSSIYTLSYSDTNGALAQKMVQTLLDIFVEDTLGKSVSESDSAISFLDKQIEKYSSLLEAAEQRREEFKRKNVGLMPQDGVNYYSQLQEINGLLEQAGLELAEARNRRNKIQSQIDRLHISKSEDQITSSYDARISEQEARLEDLLLLYTEEHPDVINARRILKSLEDKRQQELDKLTEPTSQSGFSENPVFQELQILLTKAEADVSTFMTRVASYRNKQAELKNLVDIVPRIEAEMEKLNRDYEVHKKNYTELVSRREQAKISEDVETGSEQVKFRIVEPPFVPAKPDFPNRMLFDIGVLIAALGVGYGISLLISLLQPVFYNPNDLHEYTNLPVLGGISKYDTEMVISKRKRNLFLFAMVNLFLVTTAMVFVYIHSQGIQIINIIGYA